MTSKRDSISTIPQQRVSKKDSSATNADAEQGMELHQCECAICQRGEDTAVMAHHRHINLVLSRLEEAERRWYVASLSSGPDAPSAAMLAQISGLSEKTIARGRHELDGD